MKFKPILSFIFSSLNHNKLRTTLSFTSIIIGVFAIVLLSGISLGLKQNVESKISALGTQMVLVAPMEVGGSASMMSASYSALTCTFYKKDAEKLKMVKGIEKAYPIVAGNVNIKYNGKEYTSKIYAGPYDVNTVINSIVVEKGRWLKSKNDVVVGARVDENFDDKLMVGKNIEINGRTFRIVGKLKKSGDSMNKIDTLIIVPYKTGKELLKDSYPDDRIAAIIVKVRDGFDADEVGKDIEEFLINYKHLDRKHKGFSVITPTFLKNQSNKILNVINIFLIVVSSIALIIGLVNISNTTYMNIIDRIKEIGTLKALGMLNKDLMFMYILEGVIISLIGIVIGILSGTIVGLILPESIPFSFNGFTTFISIILLLIGSIIVTYFPSKNILKITPSDALRYE